MSPASIRVRVTKEGKRRYDVRYRRGGRGYKIEHAGTFRTQAEARIRRDLIAGELAAGRDPRLLLAAIANPPVEHTVADVAAAWLTSRVDVKPSTVRTYGDHVNRITADLGTLNPSQITPADVAAWVASLNPMKPATIRNYVGSLKAILDHAALTENPARHRSIRLPRIERTTVEPPSAADVTRLLSFLGSRWQLPFRTLEQTGMRISELIALEWRDVDVHGSQFRIRQGKTSSSRRWVQVPEWLMAEIADACPPDDRTAERLVFPGFSRGSARNAMVRASRAAGLPRYTPHALRHRYASIQLKRGVPVTEVAAQLGHSKTSLTHDTYAHVLLSEEDA